MGNEDEEAAPAEQQRPTTTESMLGAKPPSRSGTVTYDFEAMMGEAAMPSQPDRRGRLSTPMLGRQSREVLLTLWTALSRLLEKQVATRKGCSVPGLGRFTFIQGPKSARTGKRKLVEPVFVFYDAVLEELGCKARSVPLGDQVPSVPDLNFAQLAMLGSCTKDVAVGVVKDLLARIRAAMAATATDSNLRVRIEVVNVGTIACDRGLAKFSFDAKWGATRPGTSQTCVGSRGMSRDRMRDVSTPEARAMASGSRGSSRGSSASSAEAMGRGSQSRGGIMGRAFSKAYASESMANGGVPAGVPGGGVKSGDAGATASQMMSIDEMRDDEEGTQAPNEEANALEVFKRLAGPESAKKMAGILAAQKIDAGLSPLLQQALDGKEIDEQQLELLLEQKAEAKQYAREKSLMMTTSGSSQKSALSEDGDSPGPSSRGASRRSMTSSTGGLSTLSMDAGVSDVMPVYLCMDPSNTTKRAENAKKVTVRSLADAQKRFHEKIQHKAKAVKAENAFVEAENERKIQHAAQLKEWRAALNKDLKVFQAEQVAEQRERRDREAHKNSLPEHGFTAVLADGAERGEKNEAWRHYLEHHRKTLIGDLDNMMDQKIAARTNERDAEVEYGTLQAELLLADMKQRQRKCAEAKRRTQAHHRAQWKDQMQSKGHIEHVQHLDTHGSPAKVKPGYSEFANGDDALHATGELFPTEDELEEQQRLDFANE